MSMVTEHYQRMWPVQSQPSIPLQQWIEYKRLKQAAADIDRVTGQPDCVKDGVDEWEAAVVLDVQSSEREMYKEHLQRLGISEMHAEAMAKQCPSGLTARPGLKDAVWCFANWNDTEEGSDYWHKVAKFYEEMATHQFKQGENE